MKENKYDDVILINNSIYEFIASLLRLGMDDILKENGEENGIAINEDIDKWAQSVLNFFDSDQKDVLNFYFNYYSYFGLGLFFFAKDYIDDCNNNKFSIKDFIEYLKTSKSEDYSLYLIQAICNRKIGKETINNMKDFKNGYNLIEELTIIPEKGKWQALKILSKPVLIKNELISFLEFYYNNFFHQKEEEVNIFINEYINNSENQKKLKDAFLDSIYKTFSKEFIEEIYESYNHIEVFVSYFCDFANYFCSHNKILIIGYRFPQFVRKMMGGTENLDRQLKVFKVLSDKTRVKILLEIKKGSKYLTEIAEIMEMSNPAIGYHINKLLGAGLIEIDKSENRIYYKLNENTFSELISQIREIFL
ncbi:MAG: ArsR/SmtB family transcription factor [archaeon]